MSKPKLVKLTVRCTEEERDKITDAAHRKGVSVNAHILERTLDPRFDGCQDWEWKRIVQMAKISRKPPARYLLDCALGEAVNVRELSEKIDRLSQKVANMGGHIEGMKKGATIPKSVVSKIEDIDVPKGSIKWLAEELRKVRRGVRYVVFAEQYRFRDEESEKQHLRRAWNISEKDHL